MAASFLRPLLLPTPFLSTPKPHLPTTPTTAVRCTAAAKPTTTSTPKPTQGEANQEQEPSATAIPDEANANPHRIPDDETPPSATSTTSFGVARRMPSAISPDRRLRRTALTQEEPLNYEIGWKRTKKPPLEKPKGWAIADFLEKLEGLMARGRYGSGALLATVAGVVTERAREEAEILVGEGGVEERVVTELFRVLRLVEMDVEMVKAAVKEETVKEHVETARARCRQALLGASAPTLPFPPLLGAFASSVNAKQAPMASIRFIAALAPSPPPPSSREPQRPPSAVHLASGVAFAAASVAAAAPPALAALAEPANALSLPTWTVHVSSVVEWVMAMALVWDYGERTGLRGWKGLSWGMVPLLGGAMCACTWHFFYNSESLEVLVALQGALTVIGNITMCIAAFRIFKASQEGSKSS